MKVLGLNGPSVIVELSGSEWEAIGGETSGWPRLPVIEKVPDLRQMADALRAIRSAKPDLKNIRATFQAFLMLTEPSAVHEVLKSCGVSERIVDDVVELKEGDSVE